jgi:hypothetical protein
MSTGHVVNGLRLQQVGVSSRTYVRQHPDDLKARLELAWCLLVEALYEAGRETAIATGLPSSPDRLCSPEADGAGDLPLKADGPYRSDKLFRESLHHAATVQQLSTHEEDYVSAKHLQSLVDLSCGEQSVAASQNRLLSRALAMLLDLARPWEDSF